MSVLLPLAKTYFAIAPEAVVWWVLWPPSGAFTAASSADAEPFGHVHAWAASAPPRVWIRLDVPGSIRTPRFVASAPSWAMHAWSAGAISSS